MQKSEFSAQLFYSQTLVTVAVLRGQCFLSTITADVPLLAGEVVEENFFTYLIAPFNGFQKGDAVLQQKTNQAELYFTYVAQQVAALTQTLNNPADTMSDWGLLQTTPIPSNPTASQVAFFTRLKRGVIHSLEH